VSDTPRMNLALRKAQEDCTESYLLTEGLKLELELNEANDRIQRLEKAGEDLAVCGYFMGFEDELKAWRKAVKDSQ
jgi:hypothetical protein